MEKRDISSMQEQMNACGKTNKPFFFALNFDVTEGIFIENPLEQKEVLFEIRGKGNKPKMEDRKLSYLFEPLPIGISNYESRFQKVHNALCKGLVSVINLTVRTPLQTDLTLFDVFAKSNSLYQVYVPNRFVCFSPEQFVKIADGKIYSNPMKGTTDASLPNAEEVMMRSDKELKEHTTVANMVKEELEAVSSDVYISRFRYVDRIKTQDGEILQTSSEVVGTLPADYQSHLGDIVFKLLPASSILGVPKEASKALIDAVEPESRGFYTGVCGYFDGNELNSGVLIRFIGQEDNQLFFHSGGGVTADSRCQSEYEEVLNKIYLPR